MLNYTERIRGHNVAIAIFTPLVDVALKLVHLAPPDPSIKLSRVRYHRREGPYALRMLERALVGFF